LQKKLQAFFYVKLTIVMKGIGFYNKAFLTIKEDNSNLEETITRILFTVPGERLNNPLFGSKLKTYLFDLETIMKEDVESEITYAINRWEPRIQVDKLTTWLEDERTMGIKLICTRIDTLEEFTYEKLVRL